MAPRLAFAVALAVAFFALAWSVPAAGQSNPAGEPALAQKLRACGPRAAVLAGLEKEFGETVAGRGAWRGGLLELTVNKTTGSWSIVATAPGPGGSATGLACLRAAGEGWRDSLRPARVPERGT